MLDTCFSEECLHEAFIDIRGDIHFKYTVQNYRLNELKEIATFRERYANGTFSFSESRPFRLLERGHERLIHPIVFRDRVVIHSFCKHVLLPKLTPYLIYDNCASLKGKGIDKSLDRMRVHLKRYFFENNTNKGYILQGDGRKFFDNLRHDVILDMVRDKLTEEELSFLALILKENEIDVSYMTDEEYAGCMDKVFNSLEYTTLRFKKTGEKMMPKSVGIGSEASQIIGLYYLHRVDNYIKIVRGFKYYARYMDDFYIIYKDKETLKALLKELKIKYREIGLEINEKKTQIRKLDKPIVFLKTVYTLTDTGKVIMRKCKGTFIRERRKLKKYAAKLDSGEFDYPMIESQYRSWRGTIMRKRGKGKNSKYMFKNYRQVARMDKLYNELFIEPFIRGDYNARRKSY